MQLPFNPFLPSSLMVGFFFFVGLWTEALLLRACWPFEWMEEVCWPRVSFFGCPFFFDFPLIEDLLFRSGNLSGNVDFAVSSGCPALSFPAVSFDSVPSFFR